MEADLDAVMELALHAAAGDLQREVAEVGAQHVAEADMRRAVRSALQFQLGRHVTPEFPVPQNPAWRHGLGPFDVAVTGEAGLVGLVELKWCRQPHKLAEALWDALKLMPYTLEPVDVAGYLVYGAPQDLWQQPGHRPAELFETVEHDVGGLIARYEADWRWLLTGNKSARPIELRSAFTTHLVASVPILSATEGRWELRASRVQASLSPAVFFDEDGWLSEDQPAFGTPAPESRFIDTDEDIQIDLSTLPESQELKADIDDLANEAGDR